MNKYGERERKTMTCAKNKKQKYKKNLLSVIVYYKQIDERRRRRNIQNIQINAREDAYVRNVIEKKYRRNGIEM